jgi:transposase-like protein
MKTSHGSPRRRARRADATRRAQLLAAFDRSGLSAADFARRHSLHYTTLYAWRRQAKTSAGFVQVELSAPVPPVELVIELGPTARLRLTTEAQIPLAGRLLQILHPNRPC